MVSSVKKELPHASIIELDFTALPGQKMLLDICKKRLAQEGVKLDQLTAARYLNEKTFAQGFSSLCEVQGKQTVDVPTVVAECQEAFCEQIGDEMTKLPAGFLAFLDGLLANEKVHVVLLTHAEKEKVLEALGEERAKPNLSVMHNVSDYYASLTWEVLRRVCRTDKLFERLTLAVMGSGLSTRSAVTASMSVIAKICPETAYQDFTGSDLRIEEFSDSILPQAFDLLRL